jgi:alcohol dehydrogenase (NADP+)
MTTRGYAALSDTAPLTSFEFDRRAPGDGDVQIAIDYCGICHSDIHTARNEWKSTVYPCVPGHEIVGHVVGVGTHVKRFKAGDRVGVGCFVDSCRTCDSCRRGEQSYCLIGATQTYNSLEPGGTTTFGGYSTQIVVDEDFVLRIPNGLDAAGAAPLLCAGITTYSPLKRVGLSHGHRLAVVGLGGLGHMAVKLGASFGADVTVVSRTREKEADARRLGAHDFVATSEERALKSHAGRFDFILDTVSAPHDVNALLGCLRVGGTMILVGAPPEAMTVEPFALIGRQRSLTGSLVGGIRETQDMLEHCAAHGIVSDIERIAPAGINAAYERVLAGDVKYRFVIDCSQF